MKRDLQVKAGEPRRRRWDARRVLGTALAAGLAAATLLGPVAPAAAAEGGSGVHRARTPIHHVVVIIGENHSFDNVFATYQAVYGNSVRNLLSEGIVTTHGTLGPNAWKAKQWQASDTSTVPGRYSIDPPRTKPYTTLPQPNTTYVNSACDGGQQQNVPDARFSTALPNGPFQITKYVPFFQSHNNNPNCQTGAYVGDPLHRFYQMWQQVNGGRNRLWTWVHTTAGNGNGKVLPTDQGAVQMGYYNMAQGDAPGFQWIADHYAMSDNYHQAVMGGTGTNHTAIGAANVPQYRIDGKLAVPPANQIENPNPLPGTNNYYTQDGYSGGSYTECANPNAPGVTSIMRFLSLLPYKPFQGGDCKPGAYYLLNNYNPGYLPNGTPAPLGPNKFTVPPQTWPTIADDLQAHHLSWGYFGQGWNHGHPSPAYCGICDPFQYATSVMTNPAKRANLHGLTAFENDVAKGYLPAVSYVKPWGPNDGHAGYSTLASFENFTTRIVDSIVAQPKLFRHTAIFVTFDEGGAYYDSGYIQPVSFFGDGTRVPMMVISPWTKPGYISHTYNDHASVVKFIEANWNLPTLTKHSFDNLPNPVMSPSDPYVPLNRPAIGDLMSLFDFRHPQQDPLCVPLYGPSESAYPKAGNLPAIPAACGTAAGGPSRPGHPGTQAR